MSPLHYGLVGGLRLYQWLLSPLKGAVFGPLGRCRFQPSCSAYALEAVSRYGAWRGLGLAMRRLCRCHPWGDCGWDPVPPVVEPRTRRCAAPGEGVTFDSAP
jgi:putative membrane protein insertion efficiency factor